MRACVRLALSRRNSTASQNILNYNVTIYTAVGQNNGNTRDTFLYSLLLMIAELTNQTAPFRITNQNTHYFNKFLVIMSPKGCVTLLRMIIGFFYHDF
jgi:hypothetical protein